MKCLKCGKDIPSGAAFCPWCGETVRKSAPQTGKIPDDIRLDALKRAAARSAESQAHQAEKNPQPAAEKPQPSTPAAEKPQPSAPAPAQSQPKPAKAKSPFWRMVWRSTFLSLSVYLMFNGMVVPGIILLLITIAVIANR